MWKEASHSWTDKQQGGSPNLIPFPDKKYKIIYTDPPWQYNDKALAGNRGAECKYHVMSLEALRDLNVPSIADTDCVLFIWGTWTHINEIQQVIEAWGFQYKTVGFVWLKTYPNIEKFFIGMGNCTRSNTEYCLFATKGKPKRIDAGISQIIKSPVRQHSKKPDEVRTKIVKLFGDLPRIELFARTKIHGWDTWGNDQKLNLQPLENYSLGDCDEYRINESQ